RRTELLDHRTCTQKVGGSEPRAELRRKPAGNPATLYPVSCCNHEPTEFWRGTGLWTKSLLSPRTERKRLESVCGTGRKSLQPITAQPIHMCWSCWRKWLRQLQKSRAMTLPTQLTTRSPLVRQPREPKQMVPSEGTGSGKSAGLG